MNIRKITAAVMAVTILAGMTACGNTADESVSEITTAEVTTVAETTTTAEETTTVTEEPTTTTETTTVTEEPTIISESVTTSATESSFDEEQVKQEVAEIIKDMGTIKATLFGYNEYSSNPLIVEVENNGVPLYKVGDFKTLQEFYDYYEGKFGSYALRDLQNTFMPNDDLNPKYGGAVYQVFEREDGLYIENYAMPYLAALDYEDLEFVEVTETSCTVNIYNKTESGCGFISYDSVTFTKTDKGWQQSSIWDAYGNALAKESPERVNLGTSPEFHGEDPDVKVFAEDSFAYNLYYNATWY